MGKKGRRTIIWLPADSIPIYLELQKILKEESVKRGRLISFSEWVRTMMEKYIKAYRKRNPITSLNHFIPTLSPLPAEEVIARWLLRKYHSKPPSEIKQLRLDWFDILAHLRNTFQIPEDQVISMAEKVAQEIGKLTGIYPSSG